MTGAAWVQPACGERLIVGLVEWAVVAWVPGDCLVDGIAGGELSGAVPERVSAGESVEGVAEVVGGEPGLSEYIGDDAICGVDRVVDGHGGCLQAAEVHTTSQSGFYEG